MVKSPAAIRAIVLKELVPTVVVWVWLIAENADNVSKRNSALVLVIFFNVCVVDGTQILSCITSPDEVAALKQDYAKH